MHTVYLGKTEGVFIDLVDHDVDMLIMFGKSDWQYVKRREKSAVFQYFFPHAKDFLLTFQGLCQGTAVAILSPD